jgi:hypothetical protein
MATRPIDTILALSRVRLVNKVPVLETEQLVRLLIDRVEFRKTLVEHATGVTEGSYRQFESDDEALVTLADEIESARYCVTRHAQACLASLVRDIFGDGVIYKKFAANIRPLFEESDYLERISGLTARVVDSTHEHSLDVARLIGAPVPRVSGIR